MLTLFIAFLLGLSQPVEPSLRGFSTIAATDSSCVWQGDLAERHLWFAKQIFSSNEGYLVEIRDSLSLPVLPDTVGSLVMDHAVCRQVGQAYGQQVPEPFDASEEHFAVVRIGTYYVVHMAGDTAAGGRRATKIFNDSLAKIGTLLR